MNVESSSTGVARFTRRVFLGSAGGLILAGCGGMNAQPRRDGARLHSRPAGTAPTASSGGEVSGGEVSLALARGRALLHVPARLPSTGAPLAVMLHGAGGRADHMRFIFSVAEAYGCVVLAPSSGGPTWDVIVNEFGPDVDAIDEALAATFARLRIDSRRVAIGGFSDGASYALSLGGANGDLFTHVLAFSPGFMTGPAGRPRPRIFMSHGLSDEVLPIDRTSRPLVPRLKRAGYDVTYREFDGPHTVPDDISRSAFEWFVGKTAEG